MKSLSSSELKTAITSMLLGDGFAESNVMSGKARFDIYHKSDNLDLILFKQQVLEQIPGITCRVTEKVDTRPLKNGDVRKGYRLQTSFSNYLFNIANSSFKLKVKRTITPLGLAILWQDNGTTVIGLRDGRYQFKFANLCTERLSIEENKRIILEWNNLLGWSPRLEMYKKNTESDITYHRLALKKEQVISLSEVIAPFVVDSMKYKLITHQTLHDLNGD